ncbi:MAG: V-type ATP synthase subunit E [Candidatus Thermoplasmatota archaeon]
MSAEKIIERIRKDTAQELQTIQKKVEQEADQLLKTLRKEARQEVEKILTEGRQHIEAASKIQISRATQDLKRELVTTKEEIMETCFRRALEQLSHLDDKQYTDVITRFMKQGISRLGTTCTVLVSRDIDRVIAQKLGLSVSGTVDAPGGIILVSQDGSIKLDYTFSSILQRKKDDLRIHLGSLLFEGAGD